jgi:GNAT superfamily N-acetyltransferase
MSAARRTRSGGSHPSAVRAEPLTASNFAQLEKLFGVKGACGGCWCMTPRLTAKDYAANKGEGNRRALRRLAKDGPPPGVLVFNGDEPIAWCAIAPREEYLRLNNSRVLAPLDTRPVWSIVCLFVAKSARRRGVSVRAIEAAKDFARSRGAECVEAYPIDPAHDAVPPVFAWTGLLSAYLAAGFAEVARRSKTRPIVRCEMAKVKAKAKTRRSG